VKLKIKNLFFNNCFLNTRSILDISTFALISLNSYYFIEIQNLSFFNNIKTYDLISFAQTQISDSNSFYIYVPNSDLIIKSSLFYNNAGDSFLSFLYIAAKSLTMKNMVFS